MLIIQILVTAFMVWLWTALLVQGMKQPSPSVRAGYWIVATAVCVLIIFRTWDCLSLQAACWP